MFRSRTLWVLGRIGSAKSDEEEAIVAARMQAYACLDPVSRPFVRRRVMRAVVDALHETERGHDERHVHRLGYLNLARIDGELPDDIEGVERRFVEDFGTLGRPSRLTVPVGCLVSFVAVLLAVSLGTWFATRPPPPLRDELPASRGAWVNGGRPDPGSPGVRALFEERLPEWTIALDRVRSSRGTASEAVAATALRQAHEAATAHSLTHLGADATSFLRAVLEQSESIVVEDSAEAADSHLRSVDAFNASVAARGLGYYVDADVLIEVASGRGRVYLSTFTVEKVTLYRSGDAHVRALRLRRLDRLNFSRAVLGFTRPQVVDALVLGERVEDHLVQQLLPGLADDSEMPLVDPQSRAAQPAWLAPLERLAAEDARAEATAIVGDAERIGEIGALFARRRSLFEGFSDRLESRGVGVRAPPTFAIDMSALRRLESMVPADEWRELAGIAAELDDADVRQTYASLEEAFVSSIERHEVQHRLDYESGTQDELPGAVEAYTGPLDLGGRDNRLAQGTNAELSAYLAELARGPQILRTNLALFLRHALDRRRWGTAECYAALVVLDGLAQNLRTAAAPLVARREVNQAAVAAIYRALRALPAQEVSDAAAALWEDLYERPLPPLSR